MPWLLYTDDITLKIEDVDQYGDDNTMALYLEPNRTHGDINISQGLHGNPSRNTSHENISFEVNLLSAPMTTNEYTTPQHMVQQIIARPEDVDVSIKTDQLYEYQCVEVKGLSKLTHWYDVTRTYIKTKGFNSHLVVEMTLIDTTR